MQKIFTVVMIHLVFLSSSVGAFAHFGMIIPSDSMVVAGDSKSVHVVLSFSHPFEGEGMDMLKPKMFGVEANQQKQDLKHMLKETKVMEHQAWLTDYAVKRPGLYVFYMEPEPYWEPAEDCYIIHYTKTVITAFGIDKGWDREIGLKTEIVPLSKPFGLYAGNVFQGIVKLDGKPVPYAEVEVEYYNEDGELETPTGYMVTQTLKADQNGVFTYAAPKSGWWGFSALNTATYTIKHNGEDKDVELGAVIWVLFHELKMKSERSGK